MTDNSSKAAGWLTPVSDDPAYDTLLEEQIREGILGITGLPDNRVAVVEGSEPPSWQTNESGCSFIIMQITAAGAPVITHQQEENSELRREEVIECVLHFYGPSAQKYATRFRDGTALSQNREELKVHTLNIQSCSEITTVIDVVNDVKTRRYDLTVSLVRKVIRLYGINTLVEAPVNFFGE